MATIAAIEIKPSLCKQPIVRVFVNADGEPKRQIPDLQQTVGGRSVYMGGQWYSSSPEKEKEFYKKFFHGVGDMATEIIIACRTRRGGCSLDKVERRNTGAILEAVRPNESYIDYYYTLWPSEGRVMVRIQERWGGIAKRAKTIYTGLLSDCNAAMLQEED